MADNVKWIKFIIGCTDGRSFKKMRTATIGGVNYRDKLEAVWFELLDFAGVCNHDGAFIDEREIPYTDIADIATQISREPEELDLCMQFYLSSGMVEIIDNIYMLSNWSKYQNNAYLDSKREYDRVKQQECRERKKLIAQKQNEEEKKDVNDMSMTNVKKCSYSYSISINNIYNSIKVMYQKCGYGNKLHKTETIKRVKNICTNKIKSKKLHPLLVLLSYGAYLAECQKSNKECEYVKGSETFLSNMVYDYAERIDDFEERAVEKYGENWKNYEIVD